MVPCKKPCYLEKEYTTFSLQADQLKTLQDQA